MKKKIKIVALMTSAAMALTGCVSNIFDKLTGVDDGNTPTDTGDDGYERLMGDIPYNPGTEENVPGVESDGFVSVDPIESDGE